MERLWQGLALLASVPVTVGLVLLLLHFYLRWKYMARLVRVFQEKPLFIIPRGQKTDDAEEVRVPTTDGLHLQGCYLRARGPRRGVILFGLEFGSNRWACRPYCERLLEHGYDILAVELRGQGDSPIQPGYDPLHWVTEYEVQDARAALAYLKARPDADPRGVGLFGISKGGGAGLVAAADDPAVRCIVTDGIFPTHSTVVLYMRKWIAIYNRLYALQEIMPTWYYAQFCNVGLRTIEKQRHCRFPALERAVARRLPCPLLMIHGAADTYIKPVIARGLFDRARGPKEFWLVEGAKHNQALLVAGDEYHRRVLAFFDEHLANFPSRGLERPAWTEERKPLLNGSQPSAHDPAPGLTAPAPRGEKPCSAHS